MTGIDEHQLLSRRNAIEERLEGPVGKPAMRRPGEVHVGRPEVVLELVVQDAMAGDEDDTILDDIVDAIRNLGEPTGRDK